MSNTIVDFSKVTQMLDAGWKIVVWKNRMGSYSAEAVHSDSNVIARLKRKLADWMREHQRLLSASGQTAEEAVEEFDSNSDGFLITDDFTPDQALTRVAYKVHGEII